MGIFSNIPVQTEADKAAMLLIIEEQKNHIETLSDIIARQEHTIKLLQKALFGQKPEKIIDSDERQGVFEDISNEVDLLNPPEEQEIKPEDESMAQKVELPQKEVKNRRSLRDLVDSALPREGIVIDLPEEQLAIGENIHLKCIGEDRVEKLAYQPGHWFIKVFVYPKYADPGNALFADGNIIECGCWMHVRRKFVEVEDTDPELRRQVLRLIRNIYRYERVLKKYDPETKADFILKIRREKIGPIINTLFTLTAKALTDGCVMLKSNFAKAISYMHNLGGALKSFLDNPYLQPDNGTGERALRPITIGRDNWMFLGSEKGGEAMGILMSLVQTCRVMNINVLEYLEDVLRRINGHPAAKLHELLPGNWKKLDSYYN